MNGGGVVALVPSPIVITEGTTPTYAASNSLLRRVDELLGETLAKLAPSILESIDEQHESDVKWAESSSLPFESEGLTSDIIEYDLVSAKESTPSAQQIAIRTKESSPLLSRDEIQRLKTSAESYWNRPVELDGSSTSRFTYQRKGNSEAHLSDIVKYSQTQQPQTKHVTNLVDELLLKRVYPWVREAFLSKEEGVDARSLQLYVYDALFIRYNATEANLDDTLSKAVYNKQRRKGAGQPLHRDLGYVSVNIMLNDQSDFEGGGTFFENQILSCWNGDKLDESDDTGLKPLKPLGAGHALAHDSSDRHAGAATFEGVRDILVIFIAAAHKRDSQDTSNSLRTAPRWECAARLKSTSRTYCSNSNANNTDQLKCRILHQRLAIEQVPSDGEAWQYLGMALMEYAEVANESVLDLAVHCLEEATRYTPCDGRLHNNLGISLERLLSTSNIDEGRTLQLRERVATAYRRAVSIQSICESIGCDVGADYERVCLNLGLYLSKQDDFMGAVDVLSRVVPQSANSGDRSVELDAESWARQRVMEDASSLLSFCRKQLS